MPTTLFGNVPKIYILKRFVKINKYVNKPRKEINAYIYNTNKYVNIDRRVEIIESIEEKKIACSKIRFRNEYFSNQQKFHQTDRRPIQKKKTPLEQ